MKDRPRLWRRLVVAALALALAGAGCSDAADTPTELVLMTHDSFALSPGVLEGFTSETGIEVTLLESGDAGTMLSQAILTKDNPIADVAFGVDNTFLSRALEEDVFTEYTTTYSESIPAELMVDARVTPIDFGYVCVNYDRAAFVEMPPPTSLRDLTLPAYRDMLVVQDPASSSPGLAFLLATIATFGETGNYTWEQYWEDLKANGVLVTSGWTEAYNGAFSAGGGGGDRPIVVSYASSPAVGVYFTDPPPAEAPTAALLDGCFRQVEYAGILNGSAHYEESGQLIDYLLTPGVQEDIPLNMFVYPANQDAALPQVFTDFSPVPVATAEIPVETIDQTRETWIDRWTDILR